MIIGIELLLFQISTMKKKLHQHHSEYFKKNRLKRKPAPEIKMQMKDITYLRTRHWYLLCVSFNCGYNINDAASLYKSDRIISKRERDMRP